MSRCRVAVLVAMVLCLAALSHAQPVEPSDPPLANWTAPPYWTPSAIARPHEEPGSELQASIANLPVSTESSSPSPIYPFTAVTPCRLIDTKHGTPPLDIPPTPGRGIFTTGEVRTYDFSQSSTCTGLPTSVAAWSLSFQYTTMNVSGGPASYLTAWPAGITRPSPESTMLGSADRWTADSAIIPGGTPDSSISVYAQKGGDVIIDINGYYAAQGVVTSLTSGSSTLTGDVTLAAGDNVTITPSGQMLTIAATGGPGGALPTGSPGQTLYNNGSSWLANSFLYNSGSAIGIGTTTPGYQLDLNGTMNMPTTTATSGTPTAGVLFLGGSPFIHNYDQPDGWGANTFVGPGAGNFTMGCSPDCGSSPWNGANNTAIGAESLHSNTTGFQNNGLGLFSLHVNTTGYDNTAIGVGSMGSNTTGYRNTAIGQGSLYYNTTGYRNTAIGNWSLDSNTTASKNTAVGSEALYTQSWDNGGTPYDTFNTAVGHQALYSNQPDSTSDGIQNAALGTNALYSNTTGSFNTGIGNSAGFNLTTGSYNIDIGNQGVAAEGNTIRIGTAYSAGAGQSSTFVAGISGVTVTGAGVLVSSSGQLGVASSSSRFKQDVADMGDASSRLMELRPVTFHYKTQPDGPLQYGLIAEEVEEVMPELVVRDATGQIESVAYHELPAMLLNELQKQQAQIEAKDARITALENQHAAQQAQIEDLTRRLVRLERELASKPTPSER